MNAIDEGIVADDGDSREFTDVSTSMRRVVGRVCGEAIRGDGTRDECLVLEMLGKDMCEERIGLDGSCEGGGGRGIVGGAVSNIGITRRLVLTTILHQSTLNRQYTGLEKQRLPESTSDAHTPQSVQNASRRAISIRLLVNAQQFNTRLPGTH